MTDHPSGGAAASGAFTMGVEEEFLLLDPRTGVAVGAFDDAVRTMPEDARALSRREFHPSQFEMATPVSADLAELRRHLVVGRRAAADAAQRAGAALAAVGATLVTGPKVPVSDAERYAAVARHYGALADDPGICGCHVHVAVPDRDTAVQVCNHLRPWLPVIQAVCANSPVYDGADTGYASWRYELFARWPGFTPTPYFRTTACYDAAVAHLVDSGVLYDEALVSWYARPSTNYPTVEVRIGDVCLTVDDTVLVAGLIRGLVTTAVNDIRAGMPAPPVPDHLLGAAHWAAARHGLDGALYDAAAAASRPAWDMVELLVRHIRSALVENDDLTAVVSGLQRLRHVGTGAARQRAAYERGGVRAALDTVFTETVGAR